MACPLWRQTATLDIELHNCPNDHPQLVCHLPWQWLCEASKVWTLKMIMDMSIDEREQFQHDHVVALGRNFTFFPCHLTRCLPPFSQLHHLPLLPHPPFFILHSSHVHHACSFVAAISSPHVWNLIAEKNWWIEWKKNLNINFMLYLTWGQGTRLNRHTWLKVATIHNIYANA